MRSIEFCGGFKAFLLSWDSVLQSTGGLNCINSAWFSAVLPSIPLNFARPIYQIQSPTSYKSYTSELRIPSVSSRPSVIISTYSDWHAIEHHWPIQKRGGEVEIRSLDCYQLVDGRRTEMCLDLRLIILENKTNNKQTLEVEFSESWKVVLFHSTSVC